MEKMEPAKLEDHVVGRMAGFKQLYHTGNGQPATTCAVVPRAPLGRSEFVVGGTATDWLDPGGSREVRWSEDASL